MITICTARNLGGEAAQVPFSLRQRGTRYLSVFRLRSATANEIQKEKNYRRVGELWSCSLAL
jgi:hypothetical protein